MTNRSQIVFIHTRAKWKRVLAWPLNFWKCFRIQGVLSIKQRARVAALMANAIASR